MGIPGFRGIERRGMQLKFRASLFSPDGKRGGKRIPVSSSPGTGVSQQHQRSQPLEQSIPDPRKNMELVKFLLGIADSRGNAEEENVGISHPPT